jgi:hypothetical protein
MGDGTVGRGGASCQLLLLNSILVRNRVGGVSLSPTDAWRCVSYRVLHQVLTYLQDSQFMGFDNSCAAIANPQFAVNVAGVPFHSVY